MTNKYTGSIAMRIKLLIPLAINRLKHQIKIFVGDQLAKLIANQHSRGKGPSTRFISGFSDEAKLMGIEQKVLAAPIPVRKLAPEFSLDGEIDAEYRRLVSSGDNFTNKAGIFSAKNVDISFPTGMHQVGNRILKEVMPNVLMNPKYYYGLESMRFKRKRPMDEGVLLSMPWHHNFYHWMIEILPRLTLYDRSQDLQHQFLIVPESAPRFVAESLRLAGYQSKTIFLEDGAYRFKKLHMLSMLAPTTEVSENAVDWLNRKFSNISSSLNMPKRVYISRCDAKIRYVSDEPKFADILTEYGFDTLIMSDLSLADQINVFRTAECIVGPHGAAFANLAFMRHGSTFIEFFSRGHYSPSYNRIASIRKLKYGFIVGQPTGIGGFSINPSHLRAILSQALHQQS